MSPLQKEVVRRYLTTFAVATVVLTLTIIVFDAAKRLLGEGLSPLETAYLLPFLLPGVARAAMQGATLLAVCVVYGRMAAKNELLGLSASGLSLLGVIWPILVISVLISLTCVWLDDVSNTWGENGFRRGLTEYAVEIAYRHLESQKSFCAADYQLTVDGVDGRTLIRPSITSSSTDPKQCVDIHAEIGRIDVDRESGNLVVELQYGTCSMGDIGRLSFTDRFRHSIPLTWKQNHATSLQRIREQEQRVEELTARLESRNRATDEEPKIFPLPPVDDLFEVAPGVGAIPTNGRTSPNGAAIAWRSTIECRDVVPTSAVFPAEEATSSLGAMAERSLTHELEDILRIERSELFWRHSLWHQKWANSFCCLTFTLIGIPISIFLRRSDVLSSFIACFLPILALYQPLQYFGMAYCARGMLSPLWLHANNVALTIIGSWGLLRVLRRY